MQSPGQPTRLSGVIFDFDGVIINTEPARFAALQKICKEYGLTIRSRDYKDMVGKKTEQYIREKFPHIQDKEVKILETKRRAYQKRFLEEKKGSAQALKGVMALVRALSRKGIKITIGTGSHREIVREILKRNGLNEYFPRIVTNLKHSKPHPECWIRAIGILKTPKAQTIIIEDAPPGITAARKIGIYSVGITTTIKRAALLRAGAGKAFSNHAQILAWLRNQYFGKKKYSRVL